MMVRLEKVIDGANRYIAREIYPNLNDLQELAARFVIGRINKNTDTLKALLTGNGFIRTLGLVDSDGMVDIEQLLNDVRQEIERKGSVQIDIPLFGKLTFKPEDVNVLRDEIMRG